MKKKEKEISFTFHRNLEIETKSTFPSLKLIFFVFILVQDGECGANASVALLLEDDRQLVLLLDLSLQHLPDGFFYCKLFILQIKVSLRKNYSQFNWNFLQIMLCKSEIVG